MTIAFHTSMDGSRDSRVSSDLPKVFDKPLDVITIPVDGQGYPLNKVRRRGVLYRDPSETLVLELASGAGFPESSSLIVGLSTSDTTTCYAGIMVCDCRYQKPDRITIIGHLGGPIQDILERDLIIPEFCPTSFQYTLPYPLELLDSLAEIGILAREYWDKVLVCPECYSLSTFRPGCPQCGSSLAKVDRLIHHFACGYVGFVSEFETPTGLHCPKCRTYNPVIGVDYEYVGGAYRCSECDWTDAQLRLICHCLRCDMRYPCREAITMDLVSFHAQRFNPLAIHAVP